MPYGTITSTTNTFGTVDGSVSGAIPGTLTGSVGVPGPQGPAGATGPTGPAGAAGVGVPAGGVAGQVLTKIDGVDYNTGWVNVDLSGYRVLDNYDFTNVTSAKLETFGLTLEPPAGAAHNSILDYQSLALESDTSNGGTVAGVYGYSNLTTGYLTNLTQTWTEVDGSIVGDGGLGTFLTQAGLVFTTASANPAPSTNRYLRSSIVFGDGSTQTIAFPGFNNAALTGNPTAPTPALGDNDTSVATTAFVQQELASGTAVARNLEVQVRNQSGSTIPAGSIVYISGATGNLPLITLAQANNDANSAQTIGFVKTAIANNGTGYVIVRGILDGINTSALSEGVQLYLSPTTAGTWTTSKPSAPQHLVYVGIVIRSHPTLGTILVSVQNGYELHELHDVAIASAANNDLLVYELSTDLWKNKSFATLGLATQSWVTSQGYLTSAPVTSVAGRTGAITLAVADVSGAAPLASPSFTGTPSLPTGTTAVTQSPGNNTTAVATTAFVQQEVPAASTTAAGKVELATNAESVTGTDTARGVTPASWYWSQHATNLWNIHNVAYSAATSGAGATAGAAAGGYVVAAPTTAVGNATGSFAVPALQRGVNRGNGSFNWSKKLSFSFRISRNSLTADANTIWRVSLGKSSVAVGDLSVRGVGAKMAGNGALQLMVHNGTSLTTVTTTSSIVPTVPIVYDIRIMSDGAGNVEMYVDDVLEASTSNGPTGTGASGQNFFVTESENAAIISTTAMAMGIYNLRIDFNP